MQNFAVPVYTVLNKNIAKINPAAWLNAQPRQSAEQGLGAVT